MPETRRAGSRALGGELALLGTVATLALATIRPAALAAQEREPAGAVRTEARTPPRPAEVLGYDPVAAERLPSLAEIVGYFETLAAASPRVRVDTIGRSTLDAPLILVTISSETNLARLEELRGVQARLADPRRISSDEEREALIRRGRLVTLVTAGTHSTEVGGPLAAMRLAHHLATSIAPRASRIREQAIVLLVPVVNPDGVDPVREWYEATLGTPWLGTEPPFLYHHYVGHDLNRDWYAFTQKETRAIVERVHQDWLPQVHHDIHQHEANGARYFVPPWLDPVEPNVDPLLVAAATSLGTRIQWTLLEEGKSGVSVAARYDAWSPSRAYVHYHGGVRILSETASARLAAPIELTLEDLAPAAGFDPRTSSWNHPVPWPGGRWGLDDIVAYMQSGALATLGIAAGERETWLRNFTRVGRRAVEGWDAWPEAWVVPRPADSASHVATGTAELLRILRTAGVEVRRTADPFDAEGRTFPAGSYVVEMHQPHAAFAQAVLARQPYPPQAEYAGGPPAPPYDVTAHNLPLLLGVEAVALHEAPPAGGAPVVRPPPGPPRRVPGLSNDPSVMVGLYRPWTPSIDEGWTRWLFDNHSVPYRTVTNEDIARGELLREHTVLVIPSIPSVELSDGRSEASVPPEFAGGLGPGHVASLRAFVDDGGTLVAWGASTGWVIEALELPVENFVDELPPAQFFAPGAQVRLVVDTATAVGAGMPVRTAAFLQDAGAFRVRAPPAADAEAGRSDRTTIVARYGGDPLTLSGWVVGESWIAGRPAVVEVRRGEGRVVLIGFRPQYRGQSIATYPLVFNSLKRRR